MSGTAGDKLDSTLEGETKDNEEVEEIKPNNEAENEQLQSAAGADFVSSDSMRLNLIAFWYSGKQFTTVVHGTLRLRFFCVF